MYVYLQCDVCRSLLPIVTLPPSTVLLNTTCRFSDWFLVGTAFLPPPFASYFIVDGAYHEHCSSRRPQSFVQLSRNFDRNSPNVLNVESSKLVLCSPRSSTPINLPSSSHKLQCSFWVLTLILPNALLVFTRFLLLSSLLLFKHWLLSLNIRVAVDRFLIMLQLF